MDWWLLGGEVALLIMVIWAHVSAGWAKRRIGKHSTWWKTYTPGSNYPDYHITVEDKLNHLWGELQRTPAPTIAKPTLADRLAALEAKKGKK